MAAILNLANYHNVFDNQYAISKQISRSYYREHCLDCALINIIIGGSTLEISIKYSKIEGLKTIHGFWAAIISWMKTTDVSDSICRTIGIICG